MSMLFKNKFAQNIKLSFMQNNETKKEKNNAGNYSIKPNGVEFQAGRQ
jgi:hypothetical protein